MTHIVLALTLTALAGATCVYLVPGITGRHVMCAFLGALFFACISGYIAIAIYMWRNLL